MTGRKSAVQTKVMRVIHAGIHTLTGFRRMCVASVTSDKNPLLGGKAGGDSLAN
jgi:hypothetical protein